jgi:carbon storage regulator
MLVLSRKIGERVVIADAIVVTIKQIDRGKVRLGIEAPANVRIVREEIQTRVFRSDSATASAGGDTCEMVRWFRWRLPQEGTLTASCSLWVFWSP